MKAPGLLSEIKNNPKVLAAVIVFHLVLVVLLSISLFKDNKPVAPAAKKHNIIDAVVVDAKQYDEREKQKKLAAQKKRDEEKRRKEAQKKLKQQQELEKKKQAEARRKKELERKKAAEKKKQLALKKKKEEELKRKKAAEKKAREKKLREQKALEEKKRLEAERRKKLEQQRLEAERKRLEEEERKRRAEEKAEIERALLEEERMREQARKAAERAARLQTQREQYIMDIAQDVENNWLRPATNVEGQSCDVIVTQAMSGDVIDVRLQSCSSSSDNAFKRSVERAVRTASPLPKAPNPDVFEREIYFTFKPR